VTSVFTKRCKCRPIGVAGDGPRSKTQKQRLPSQQRRREAIERDWKGGHCRCHQGQMVPVAITGGAGRVVAALRREGVAGLLRSDKPRHPPTKTVQGLALPETLHVVAICSNRIFSGLPGQTRYTLDAQSFGTSAPGHFLAGARTGLLMQKHWLSVDDFAANLGANPATICKWITCGKMQAHKMGRLWRALASQVVHWFKKCLAAEDASSDTSGRVIEWLPPRPCT
jgi:excisionase family DNA binding protein